MKIYKYFLLIILMLLFGLSVYSTGRENSHWNKLRWIKDINTTIPKSPFCFNVPPEGETYMFECVNSSLIYIADIHIDGQAEPVNDSSEFIAKWGHVKVKNNQVSVFLNATEKSTYQQIIISISSGNHSTLFNFYIQPENPQ